MTEAGWTRNADVKESGFYWLVWAERLPQVVQVREASVHFTSGLTISLEEVNGQFLGPLTPDSYQQGRVACLGDVKRYVERQIKIGEDFIGGPDPNIQRRVALNEVIEYCDRQLAQAQDDQSMKGEQ